MRRTLLVFMLLLSVSAQAAVSNAASSEFEAKLRAADEAKASDPLKFMEFLPQLQSDAVSASALQRQHLKYLEAYYTGIYLDEITTGAQLAKALFDQASDIELKYRSGALAANFFALSRDFSNGIRYLTKTMEMRNSINNRSVRHEGIGAAAVLYNEMAQYRIGMRYADELLSDRPSPQVKCFAGLARHESIFELGLLKPGDIQSIQEVIDHCRSIRELISANLARGVLARKLAADGDSVKAAALLEAALPEVQATRYPRLIAEFHSLIAELKLTIGDAPSAEAHARSAIAMGEQIPSSSTLVSAYHTLYRIAASREKQSVALELYKRYAESEMARMSDARVRELAYEIARHQTNQQAQQLQRQLELERNGAKQARLAMVTLMLLMPMFLLTGIVFSRLTQFKRLAQTDTLTGLGNRHFFTQKSERALVAAARTGEPVALIMFDLDHFKAINDTYGHDAGDWVLKQVGKICSAHCRKTDYLGRIGGEEFAMLLRGMNLATAAQMAEGYRAKLAQIDTRQSDDGLVVTASFGVSSTEQSSYDLSNLLSHADQMMYRAKNEGRNRVCVYTANSAKEP
ncbi:MAG: GGDEF domain-containing protein [Lysobacter sp.]|nr:GGDEF domain-containing protein [Lysobacter sp.]